MLEQWEHEDVVMRRGRRSGVAMVVATHSRALGPAVGGCRLWRYPDWRAGLADALRLSKAMTVKCAVAGLPFGGGKSVVALPPDTELTPLLRQAVLEDLGEIIGDLDGGYLPGPDVGTGPEDMLVLARHARKVFCKPESHGGTGSSSGPTAVGVLAALRAGARDVFGTASVAGRRVTVSGLGAVGGRIAAALAAGGAELTVSDVDIRKRAEATAAGWAWVEPDEALRVPADILVPAAVGGVFGEGTVEDVTAALVVGPANNQLTDDSVAGLLAGRGIVWVPDFVASAGGVVYTLSREFDGLDHDAATRRVEGIGDTVTTLLASARASGDTPLHEAMALARRRIAA
ncbi:Glu/Leu/Phe/Val dehydrogenase dimerization domain-containing protein [Amycolatopsis suaedae]|uniref:Glu/Leu/Phe/Val dehydrogenase n=1 Tax=Amycolatopsis suaedae TaxID=2510978 RepID=A0A4Q7JAV8_9PSEU|nr:Glu/Leu/Phe/Val dehydrogenase dimerization domain-containing protein [Amycolatopsis suaedae]RZQ64407.1 Glu/Leu/Phe/Val dehydrogenase [Amycolatopsis suaedae]